MENVETNSALIKNFFKKNYIKMSAFIAVSLIISVFLSFENNKKTEFFYSKFQVIFNKSVYVSGRKNLPYLDLDFIYYLEKKGFRNSKLLKNINTSDVVQIEIQHKNLDDKGTKQYDEYFNLVEDYKKSLLSSLDESKELYIEEVNEKVTNYEELILNHNYEVEEIKKLISKNKAFFVSYDGIIHSRKVNTILKNIIVTFCINIIIILLILWLKIFLREMRKNT